MIPTALLLLLTTGAFAPADPSPNLLQNPGFENPGDWKAGWTIENAAGKDAPYFYRIAGDELGHVQMPPHSGANALEIYSSGSRVARLSQTVNLPAPGKYRVTVFGVIQGGSDDHQIHIGLGDQVRTIPVVSLAYREYHVDFDVKAAGPQTLSFISSSLGTTLDDLTLTQLPADGSPLLPNLYFDLLPGSRDRSQGIQSYFVNQAQWVDFAITCLDPSRLKHPRLNLFFPPSVHLSGINEAILARWKNSGTTDPKVRHELATLDGIAYDKYSFDLPRFVEGPAKPLEFGGMWVEVPSGKKDHFLVQLEDQDISGTPEEIILVPVQPPARHATPKRIHTLAYDVQDWKQDPADGLQNIPRQFALMGFNTWSDYGLSGTDPIGPAVREPQEKVRQEAARHFGVKEFWPNYSELLQTGAEPDYPNISAGCPDPDMFVVRLDGSVDKGTYNTRYAARGGTAWRDSALRAHLGALARPKTLELGYTNSGIVTDALEFLRISYDPTTLREFAALNHLDPAAVTPASVQGRYKDLWLAYNMRLYADLMRTLATAIHQTDPGAKLVNTANSFGPNGVDALPLAQRCEWARFANYTMPQWYGFMRNYSDEWDQVLAQGVQAKVYGLDNGYAGVIPLLDLSMGYGLEDPLTLRFKMFDLLSASSAVKGIGYYQGYRAFTDAKFMAGLSRAHTNLADVEDYYLDGVNADAAASFTPDPGGPAERYHPKTTVRIHKLNKDGRLALLTIVTHCNRPLGEKGTLTINLAWLLPSSATLRESDWALVDRLTNTTTPFTGKVTVDTTTGNLALLEIVSREWLARHPGAIP